ncbi:MAG: four helix bundle protein [Pyrinomonadaceae bacterium]|nr:four helix bundle protein [Pyrinomonadaceae bacterium]
MRDIRWVEWITMNYKRFEQLPVWIDAIEFAVKVFEFSKNAVPEFKGLGDLRNQLERAAVSISNNVAEGFERKRPSN